MTFTAPASRAESAGTTTLSRVVQIDTHCRAGRSFCAPVQCGENVTVRGELLACSRARARHEAAQGGQLGAVLRRTEGDHPARKGSTTVVANPQPRDDPAGGVADDVDCRRTGTSNRRGSRPTQRDGLAVEVPQRVSGQRDDVDDPTAGAKRARQRLQRGHRAAVAGNEQHRPEVGLCDPM